MVPQERSDGDYISYKVVGGRLIQRHRNEEARMEPSQKQMRAEINSNMLKSENKQSRVINAT